MRGFGVGVLNGSLWTIPVEVQFYFALPLLLALVGMRRRGLWAVTLLFGGLYWVYAVSSAATLPAHKLIGLTFLPWFALFLLGVMASVYWAVLKPWVAGRFGVWLALYVGMHLCGAIFWPGYGQLGNSLSVPYVIVLAGLVLSAAYTMPTLSDRLLRKNDISYGIYIYHMPVANLMIYWGMTGSLMAGVCALCSVLLLAGLSWGVVERPALKLKTGVSTRP